MMMVSMVMPETGLRAVVAMALAATLVKKNENTSASSTPDQDHGGRGATGCRATRHGDRAHHHAQQDGHHRDIAVGALAGRGFARRGKLRTATPKEPATMRMDLTIPKMPAVAMAPTPTKRTYPRKICVAVIWRDGDGGRDRPAVVCSRPIIHTSGTSTKLESTPPAHRIIELRRPIT